MDLYHFYKELNKKLLEDFKKIIEKNPDNTTPLKVKKRLTEKLTKWMETTDGAPPMSEQDKKVHVTVSRYPPNSYTVRTILGVNKMVVMTKYDSLNNEFVQYVARESKLKPTVDI